MSGGRVVGVGLAGVAAIVAVSASWGRSDAAERLPDLRQEAPYAVSVEHATAAGRTTYRLVFASAVSNVGAGPLVVDGLRPDRGATAMVADQVVSRADGSTYRARGIGRLRYVVSPDHEHWHLLPFERYELTRAGGSEPLVRDAKTGFCLGDRYTLREALPGKPEKGAFQTRCGRGATGLLRIREGISVGYGDDYKPSLEGQWLSLDGLPPGRYVLVHRVDVAGRLRQADRSNDVASALLMLTVRGGVPTVRVLQRCWATADCG